MAQFAFIAAVALKVLGSIQEGRVAHEMGKAGRTAKEYEAAQLESNAKQTVAASQRKMQEEKRKSDLIASRALAIAAAGGGAGDKSVVNIISDLKGEGSYRAMLTLYEGEDRARLLRNQAGASRFEGEMLFEAGKAKKRAANINAAATAAISMYAMYNTPDTTFSGTGNYATSESQVYGDYTYTDPGDVAQAKRYGL